MAVSPEKLPPRAHWLMKSVLLAQRPAMDDLKQMLRNAWAMRWFLGIVFAFIGFFIGWG